MRRKDRELTTEAAWEVAARCTYGVVSMTDAEGNPYAMPVNLVCVEDCLYFHAAMEGKKTDCLKNNPHVCVNFVEFAEIDKPAFTTRYASAIAMGIAEEVTDEEERTGALRALCLFLAPEIPRSHGDFSECRGKTAIWKIKVTTMTGKCNPRPQN